jgi:hypothetical protein
MIQKQIGGREELRDQSAKPMYRELNAVPLSIPLEAVQEKFMGAALGLKHTTVNMFGMKYRLSTSPVDGPQV